MIIGAGGLGREFLDIILAINSRDESNGLSPSFDPIGFLDDNPTISSNDKRLEILGSVEFLQRLDREVKYVIGIGDVNVRQQIHSYATANGFSASVLIHPDASLGSYGLSFGEGTVICANSSLTTNIELGLHVHVNLNSTIGHDNNIGSFVSVNPGVNISGNVQVGERVLMGTGSTVLQGISIGADSTIGANALVTKNVPSDVIAIGLPAKFFNK